MSQYYVIFFASMWRCWLHFPFAKSIAIAISQFSKPRSVPVLLWLFWNETESDPPEHQMIRPPPAVFSRFGKFWVLSQLLSLLYLSFIWISNFLLINRHFWFVIFKLVTEWEIIRFYVLWRSWNLSWIQCRPNLLNSRKRTKNMIGSWGMYILIISICDSVRHLMKAHV